MIALWDHQVRMVNWMLGRESGLVHGDMGVGKTLAALTAIWRGEFERTLVVTKKKAVGVWLAQAEQYGFTDAGMVLVGDADEKLSVNKQISVLVDAFNKQAEHRHPLVVVLNYERVWKDVMYALLYGAGFEALILDESHKAKSHNGKASNALFSLGQAIPRRWLLTGTPMPNGPLDMYGQWRIIDPRLVSVDPRRRGFIAFRAHYAVLDPVRGAGPGVFKVTGYKNMDEFQAKMAATTLQIRAEDVIDLPEKVHITRPVTLGKEARRIYSELKKDYIADVAAGVITADNVLVKSLRLHQLAGGFVKADNTDRYELIDDTKIEEVLDLLDSLPPGEPLVVFVKYTAEVNALSTRLNDSGYKTSVLSGKHNQLKDWQDGKSQVLLVQIDAGAEGISLVRARYVVYYSMDYSLGKYEQSMARIARPGQQSKTVWYYYIIARGTIDNAIVDALTTKQNVNEAVLGALADEQPILV